MPPEVTLNCLFLPYYGSNLQIRTPFNQSITNIGSLFQFKARLQACEYTPYGAFLDFVPKYRQCIRCKIVTNQYVLSYTALEIGSERPKNGAFLDFVCQNIDAKMSARAQRLGKIDAILNNITQHRKRKINRKMPPEVTLNCLFLPYYGSNLQIRTPFNQSITNIGSLFQFKARLQACVGRKRENQCLRINRKMPPEVTLNCLFLPYYGSNLQIRTPFNQSITNIGSLFQFKARLQACEYPLSPMYYIRRWRQAQNDPKTVPFWILFAKIQMPKCPLGPRDLAKLTPS